MESTLMKRLWFIAILAAGVTACVEGNNPVQLVNAFPLTDSCDLADKARLRGMLNFNAGTSYNIAFTLYSPLEVAPGDNASPAGFTAQEIILSYEARNPKVTLNEESEPIYFVVPPGADTESYIALNLIGTEARKKLDTVVPIAPDFMTLLATVKLKGRLASGKEVETNEATYPIDITRANSCGPGTVPVTTSDAPCAFPGQDANFSDFTCAPATGG
jgi:hypothetical protein